MIPVRIRSILYLKLSFRDFSDVESILNCGVKKEVNLKDSLRLSTEDRAKIDELVFILKQLQVCTDIL